MRLRPRFEKVTGRRLHAGMKVLLQVKASFHPAYGFSWNIIDIDPTYTMGDLARRRQEIIAALKEEGVFDLNKSIGIPMFAQRIAVISSETAAGYGDFCGQLADNPYGFQFSTRLFPAVMQGEMVEQSVISALDSINAEIEEFDVVVIIRGGGATSDLSGFDTLALAENVANFPLPVITGIGHDRDESVLDMISCVRVKTPTAAADFLISNLADTLATIEDLGHRLVTHIKERLSEEKVRMSAMQSLLPTLFYRRKSRETDIISSLSARIQTATARRLQAESARIDGISQRLPLYATSRLDREKHRLEMISQRADAVNPIHILRRGYSIALHEGKAVKDSALLSPGDSIDIVMAEGKILAEVKKKYE